MSSFVKQDLIDEAQESSHYIIEEEIPALCGSESVNEDMVLKAGEECATLRQMIEEKRLHVSSDSEETGSYSSADEHSEIEPL